MKQFEILTSHLTMITRLIANQPWSPKSMPRTKQKQKIQRKRLNTNRVKKSLQSLPAKRAFHRLCQDADAGLPDAVAQLRKLIDQTPDLLDSMSNMVSVVRDSALRLIMEDNILYREALEAKIREMQESIKSEHKDDPIRGMAAEILAVAYLDAMRCSLLAAKDHEKHSDEVHYQRLADRSLRRFERMHVHYEKFCSPKK